MKPGESRATWEEVVALLHTPLHPAPLLTANLSVPFLTSGVHCNLLRSSFLPNH